LGTSRFARLLESYRLATKQPPPPGLVLVHNQLSSSTPAHEKTFLMLAALIIAAFYTSISGVVKAELFPTEVRALGVGLTYAIGNNHMCAAA
jgi:hypothetical protein